VTAAGSGPVGTGPAAGFRAGIVAAVGEDVRGAGWTDNRRLGLWSRGCVAGGCCRGGGKRLVGWEERRRGEGKGRIQT